MAPRAASPAPKAAQGGAKGESKESSVDADRSEVIDRLKAKRLVISEEGLKRIAEHKYVPGVYTPLDNLFNKILWTPLVDFLPRWMAPNAVTVTGLVLQILGFGAVAMYCTDFRTVAPVWAYAVATFSIFAYQTLDAIDGKQARRTGSSSPLGQLFDHGCDSVVTIFIGMLTGMCLHLGFSVRCVTFLFCMLLPFWMAQWTEYHAHSLPTSVGGIVGVTEAQLTSMLIAVVNVFDTDFWGRPLGIGDLPPFWCNRTTCPIAFNDLLIGAQLLIAVAGISQCFYSVLTSKSNKVAAFVQTIPVFMLAIVGYAWCIMVPQAHPRLVLFSLGVSFSYMTCKMIVAAMSKTTYNTFQPILLPLPIIFFISWFQLLPRHDDVMLGAYSAVTLYSMGRWVRNAIEEISHYIGIYAFRLGPRKKDQ